MNTIQLFFIQLFFNFAILLLVPTLVVKYVSVMVLGFNPSFRSIFISTIGGFGVAILAVFVFNLVFASPLDPFPLSPLVITAACFLGPSYLYGNLIEDPETDSIGVSKGCILTLILFVSLTPISYYILGVGLPWISLFCKVGQLAPYHCIT